jgi:hypothetical protein
MAVSNDVEDPQPSARALSSRSNSVGQHHDPADEQHHKVRFHFLSPRPAIAPSSAVRWDRSAALPLLNLFSAPEMALRRLPLLVRACLSRWRRSPTSSGLAQKRCKRGNIATALAFERANFADSDDGHSGLTATYVATSGLTSQGPLPPPCSAGRSLRDPVSSLAFRFGHRHLGRWHAPPAFFRVVCPSSQIADAELCLLLLQRRLPFALGLQESREG